jgi:hypothetical protein
MRRNSRVALPVLAACFVLMATLAASAGLPSSNLVKTDMVNGPVRALAQAGNDLWIGGAFTQVLDSSGNPIQGAGDLVAFNSSGQLDTSVQVPLVTKTTGSATVYGLSQGPNGDLYLAGSFNRVDGAIRDGAAAIDPTTGDLLPFAPKAGAAKSILATSYAVYVGTAKLLSFQLSGAKTPGYTAPTAHIDATLRGHLTLPAFRGLAISGTTLVAACQCDSMDDANANGHPVKAIVEVNANTGDLLPWAAGGLGAANAAWGITPIIHDAPGTSTPTIYLAAGGNDFAAAYDLSTGNRLWLEDCSGSCQGITWLQGDLVVGGHFDWTSKVPSGDAGTCHDNDHPNVASCYLSPHLVAMDPATGQIVLDSGGNPWNPGICCMYNGVWVVLADSNGTTLHVGGEFTRAGTATWTYNASTKKYTMKGGVKQDYYARFDAPLPPAGSASGTAGPAG